MSWQVRSQHVDIELGHHILVFHNPESGAVHVSQVVVGAAGCPLCGHVYLASADGLDMKAIIAQELELLEKGHQQAVEHAKRHRVPFTRGDGKIR